MTPRQDGGPDLAYLASSSGGGVRPVLLIHSWWGLTSSFTAYADELATRGFTVGCVDLYRGDVAHTEEEARRLRRRRGAEPAYRILQRALAGLTALDRGAGPVPAVVGFSMGGHWAVWLAQHPDPPVSAVVLHYAARAGDFSPTNAPVLAHFAARDAFVTTAARRTMERAINRSGNRYTAFDYPGTRHWFAESSRPEHDPAAARIALKRTADFLADPNPNPGGSAAVGEAHRAERRPTSPA